MYLLLIFSRFHAIPTIGNVKLACWNAINDREDEELPADKDVFIVDFTKKKSISMVRNDTELGRVTNIGILWQVFLFSACISCNSFKFSSACY